MMLLKEAREIKTSTAYTANLPVLIIFFLSLKNESAIQLIIQISPLII